MIDTLGQIDAVIEQHTREIQRLQVARSVILELANPNRVKGAVIEAKNRNQGITIQRIAPPPPQLAAPLAKITRKTKSAGVRRKDPKAVEINAMLSGKIVAALEEHGPLKSKELGDRIGFKKDDDRQRLYQRLYDLKVRGLVSKLEGGAYGLTAGAKESDAA
jgi:hypothetical protein